MVEIKLTQGQIAIVDDIDEDLSNFRWYARFDPGYTNGGQYIARRNKRGVLIGRTAEYLHRVIMERILSRQLEKGELVDHIDRNTLNNRRSNLRLATHSENMRNRDVPVSNTSGYKGVAYREDLNKWQARIVIANRRKSLGFFDNPIEAALSYNRAAIEYYGEFAVLNRIEV